MTMLVQDIPVRASAPHFFQALSDRFAPEFIWQSTFGTSGITPAPRTGRYTYIGFSPLLSIELREGSLEMDEGGKKTREVLAHGTNPFCIVERCLTERLQKYERLLPRERNSPLPPLIPGAVGYFAYDSARYLERIKGMTKHDALADCYFTIPSRLIVIDHETDLATLCSFADEEESSTSLVRWLRDSAEASVSETISTQKEITWRGKFNEASFIRMVERGQEYIAAGDIYQVVLANTFTVSSSPDPVRLYAELTQLNPSPHHFLIQLPRGASLVGASPETLLRSERVQLESGEELTRVYTRPVAGTYPRSGDLVDEASVREKFLRDEKEQAEHVMLIDLARNDLGRVSRIGSVRVTDLLSTQAYSHVFHLYSQVGSDLREDATPFSALSASFPIGTMSGTPKIRAMEIIAELEGPSRGTFGGAVAMIGANGMVDVGVAIRAAIIEQERTTIQTGAGIVYDSNPAREYQECLWKANAMFRALARV